MEIGMLTLLGKTVTLLESLGFLWLVYTGFELGFWEQLQEEKSKEKILEENSNWDPLLSDHWLEQAKIQGLLQQKDGKYSLSRIGKAIVSYKDYGLEAIYKEFVIYWGPVFADLPQRLTQEKPHLRMAGEMENELISRASRASEPFVWPLLRKRCKKEHWKRILDVGCGEGFYLKQFMKEFPEVYGLGLEVNHAVVERARIQTDFYSERLKIQCEDVLNCADPAEKYDCCLLNNNIYYFTMEQRRELLTRIKKWLVPGGRIGILTALRGVGSSLPFLQTHIPQNLMSFFLANHEGFSGLPYEQDMNRLLEAAGFIEIEVTPLPFKASHYFFARKPLE